MYRWIKRGDKHILLKTDTKDIVAFVKPSYNGFTARKLTPPVTYFDTAKVEYDLAWTREVIGTYSTEAEAKKAAEACFNIVEVENGEVDVLKFLAQLKNVEVFGKLEITIRIEGLKEK
jgi:hypothetical protein